MKSAVSVLLLLLLAAGCSSAEKHKPWEKQTHIPAPKKAKQGPLGVQDSYPNEFMFVSGGGKKAWYSSMELENLVRHYAEAERLDFNYQESTKSLWINTEGGKKLGTLYYNSPDGRSLMVEIGRDGKILGHSYGPAERK